MLSINSKSTKAEIKAAYQEAILRVAELEAMQANKVLSLDDYRQDFNRRLQLHDVEFALAVRDAMNGFNKAADFLGNAKKATVELFPINR